MATSKIKYDGDTTWKSGESAFNAPMKWRIRNGICTITGHFKGEQAIGDTEVLMRTFETKYAPTVDVYFPIVNRSANTGDGYGYIKTTGQLYMRNPFETMSYFDFCVSYPVG